MINLRSISGRGDFKVDDPITEDIDFTASSSEDITIDIGKEIREVLRGRLYIDADPGADFSQWAILTFYNKSSKLGEDAFYRTEVKLVYTELDTATTGSDANIIPDTHDNFSPNNLVYFIDGGSSEFERLLTVASTMVAEDNPDAHAIDVGLVRVAEFAGFPLFNMESGTNIYVRVKFSAAQTVSIKMELVLSR